MPRDLKPGLSAENTVKVSREMVIDFLGGEGAVLSTPAMINLMEHTCRTMVKPYLGDGEESLGAKVDASHLAATPLGKDVTIKASLTKVEGRKLTFHVEAFDEKEKIGEALHERIVVSKEKFLTRLMAKKDS